MDNTTDKVNELLAEQHAEDAKRRHEYNANVAAGYFICAFFLIVLGALFLYSLIHFTSILTVLGI